MLLNPEQMKIARNALARIDAFKAAIEPFEADPSSKNAMGFIAFLEEWSPENEALLNQWRTLAESIRARGE